MMLSLPLHHYPKFCTNYSPSPHPTYAFNYNIIVVQLYTHTLLFGNTALCITYSLFLILTPACTSAILLLIFFKKPNLLAAL
ncbi:hypothetical protein EJD97_017584 [Solanum chilense]|uniref:Uncharacterized protein n=1 Tax=Solanum chilense TaxID=4083 RepID=A0A6N2B2R9_SOLCI|nr:hypothetical protein EJD97_017584 [Solanum chilense]